MRTLASAVFAVCSALCACGPSPSPAPSKVDAQERPAQLKLPQPIGAPPPEVVSVPLMEVSDTDDLRWLRPPEEATGCIAQWALGDANVLDELRKHGAVDDFPQRYVATTFEPAQRYEAMEALAAKAVEDTPYLWRDVESNAPVVDARSFGDLDVVDVTRLEAGVSARIGTLTDAGHEQLYPRAVLSFLLESRALATWVHTGSTICLASERSEPGRYVAVLTGSHVYFTNEKNEDPLRFEFSIEPDASLMVKSLDPA